MSQPLQTAVVGAMGYAGFELSRILYRHPRLAKPALFSREDYEPVDLSVIYPQVAGNGNLPIQPFSWEKVQDCGAQLLFLATPHELSRAWVPEAMKRGVSVIDLSGAWRLQQESNRAIYNFKDADAALAGRITQQAVYGLPELNQGFIRGSQLVANPGCYATSIILPLSPLVKAGLLDPDADIICDSKSGVSGAGKMPKLETHFVEVADNLSAYSVFHHRHTGEILEQLGLQEEQITFTPHLLPIPRGILSTIYVRLRDASDAAAIGDLYKAAYQGRPFVRLFGGDLPQIRYSVGTNFCDIGWTLDKTGRRLVIVSCLDNLIKGAAGQAVQNMNLMNGWDEREGLQ